MINIELLGGEFVVTSGGIFTFAHSYIHPETSSNVDILGTNHAGDKEYFEQIGSILDSKEVVLYEGSSANGVEEVDINEHQDFTRSLSTNIDEAFFPVIQTYFTAATRTLKLESECQYFDYNQEHWIQADGSFFKALDEEGERKMNDDLRQKLAAIPRVRKQAVVDYVRSSLQDIEEGRFSRKDFANGFVFFWSDPLLTAILIDVIGKPRDDAVFKTFDFVIEEQNPRSVGIKFGAAHIAYQRTLIEQRGYILQNTRSLRNLQF